MILFLWQLPQNILGLVFFLVYRKHVKNVQRVKGVIVYSIYHEYCRWGLSLGKFIFITELYSQPLLLHEIGHSKQSKMLGPLYLIIVGIPSFVLFQLHNAKLISHDTYIRMFPENWADRLGGVVREDK